MIKHITSLQNQLIKDIASLKNSSLKKSKNLFLIEGEDLVSLAYQEKQIDLIISLKEEKDYLDIDQIIVNEAIIKKLSNNKSPFKYCLIDDTLNISFLSHILVNLPFKTI